MTAARRDAPWGALSSNENRRVAPFDAVVRIEDRRVNDRPEPLTGGVRRIRRNERVDEDLIPVQHLRSRSSSSSVIALSAGPAVRPDPQETVEDWTWSAETVHPIAASPRVTIKPTVTFRDVLVMAFLSAGRPVRPPARWNAGTPVCRVNILKNAPETAGLSRRAGRGECAILRPSKRSWTTPSPGAVTELLRAWGDGDDGALEQLTPLVEAELRRLARGYMRRERRGHTLQTTALVNEAFLRLTDARRVRWQDRAHFLGISARLMRRVLVDHARSRGYRKRGGGAERVTLDEGLVASPEPAVDVVALDRALEALAAVDARKSRVIELRFFGGLSVEETAEVLHVSPDTVKRDWRLAKLWLLRELEGEGR